MTQWVEWHEDYERPERSLSRRLEVVRDRLRRALDAAGASATILSLCSGDGRDVIGVLRNNPGSARRAVLVELDPSLADRARQSATAVGLTEVEVRCGDAGSVESFIDVLPVDVLLLCGIFGNIQHGSVKRVIELIPSLVRVGGYAVWTRGGSDPDRRPEIRAWFVESGLEEVAFDGVPEPYGVGVNQVTGSSGSDQALPERLFSFE